MVALAKCHLSDKNAIVHHATMETYTYPIDTFDLVTSRFAIHYVSDLDHLIQQVHASLRNNGRFIFSVQHPLTTSSFTSKQSGERRENWIVDDYFLEGERKEPWIAQVVVKYHRTTEHYFRALRNAGFSVVDLREGEPKREHFSSAEEYARRKRIPLVLLFSCIKKAN
jgi:SAM-dependent methyltransferase